MRCRGYGSIKLFPSEMLYVHCKKRYFGLSIRSTLLLLSFVKVLCSYLPRYYLRRPGRLKWTGV